MTKLLLNNKSKFSSMSVSNKVYLAENRPTKMDNDVFKSFASSKFKAKLHLYRNVYNWYQVSFFVSFFFANLLTLKEMRQHTEAERAKWPAPTRKSTRAKTASKATTPDEKAKAAPNRLTLTPATSVPMRQRARLLHRGESGGTEDLRRKLFQDT